MDSLLSLLPYIQIVLAIVLVGAILMQQRGAGLGGAFGGSEGTIHYERRGFEKTLFKATIALAIAFVATTALPIFLVDTTSTIPSNTSSQTQVDTGTTTQDLGDIEFDISTSSVSDIELDIEDVE